MPHVIFVPLRHKYVAYTPIQCHIPEDQNRQLYRCGNVKIHFDIEYPRRCIKSQMSVFLTLQSQTSYNYTRYVGNQFRLQK
jgi:hypothetical protein